MPRASFAMVGSTYMQILSKTLPSAKEGLEMFGIYEDVDYVVGRCGKKKGFEMPFQPPSKWDNIIHFSNGTIFQLVSLDRPDSGRGLNSFGEVGDEATLLDYEKLYNNVMTTNRAKKEVFKGKSLLNCRIYMSSVAMTRKGKWFTDMEKRAKEEPAKYAFIKANAYSNIKNLDPSWFTMVKKEAPSDMHYKAEILNIRPNAVQQAFYPQLNSKIHYYTDYNNQKLDEIGAARASSKSHSFTCETDLDCVPNKPLILSMDFGGAFNCLGVAQEVGDEYRQLKSMWAKSPKIIDDLINEQFVPYYAPHEEKKIYFYYGHDGNNRIASSRRTYADHVCDLLKAAGWKVFKMSRGAAPTHMDKFLFLNTALKGHPKLPKIRINEENNEHLIISLENAETKEGNSGDFKKDKSQEKNKSADQATTTHLSDMFDIPIYSRYYQRITLGNSSDYMPISASA